MNKTVVPTLPKLKKRHEFLASIADQVRDVRAAMVDYALLNSESRGMIRGMIRHMLKAKKYKEKEAPSKEPHK